MKNTISVIVPAFNAEKTIEKCIKSIINQSYTNLEIIIVDDGSTDNTPRILADYKNNDARVNVITIPNNGVSHARNIGIDNATGEYITFVDSDDFIDNNMYDILMNVNTKYSVDIIHCSYKNVEQDGTVSSIVGDKGTRIVLTHDEAISCIIEGNVFSGGVWNKLYKRDLFDGIRFNEKIKFNEDILLNYYVFDKIKNSVYIDDALYSYVAVQNSATHIADSIKMNRECLFVSEEIERESELKCYSKAAHERVAKSMLCLYRSYIFSDKLIYKDEKKKLMDKIIYYKKCGYYLRRNDKINIIMYKYFPIIFKHIYKYYDKIRDKQLDPKQ